MAGEDRACCLHLSVPSKATASLAFGLLMSVVSVVMLVVAVCVQSWAVRTELAVLANTAKYPDLDGDVEENVQINIPMEVPTLKPRTVYMPETFYNGKLDELYNKRLKELSEIDPEPLKHDKTSKRTKRNKDQLRNNVNISRNSDPSLPFYPRKFGRSMTRHHKELSYESANTSEREHKYYFIQQTDPFFNIFRHTFPDGFQLQRYKRRDHVKRFLTRQLMSVSALSNPLNRVIGNPFPSVELTPSITNPVVSSASLPDARDAGHISRKRSVAELHEPALIQFSICLWRLCLHNMEAHTSDVNGESA